MLSKFVHATAWSALEIERAKVGYFWERSEHPVEADCCTVKIPLKS